MSAGNASIYSANFPKQKLTGVFAQAIHFQAWLGNNRPGDFSCPAT
jgi:hypothetical protein